jgi:hypothetical protein
VTVPVTGVEGAAPKELIVAFVDEADEVHPSLLTTVKE